MNKTKQLKSVTTDPLLTKPFQFQSTDVNRKDQKALTVAIGSSTHISYIITADE